MTLTDKQIEERERISEEISSLIAMAYEDQLNGDFNNVPWKKDLRELFDNDQDKAFIFIRTIFEAYDIETDFEPFTEFDKFSNLLQVYQRVIVEILNRKNLLTKEEEEKYL